MLLVPAVLESSVVEDRVYTCVHLDAIVVAAAVAAAAAVPAVVAAVVAPGVLSLDSRRNDPYYYFYTLGAEKTRPSVMRRSCLSRRLRHPIGAAGRARS